MPKEKWKGLRIKKNQRRRSIWICFPEGDHKPPRTSLYQKVDKWELWEKPHFNHLILLSLLWSVRVDLHFYIIKEFYFSFRSFLLIKFGAKLLTQNISCNDDLMLNLLKSENENTFATFSSPVFARDFILYKLLLNIPICFLYYFIKYHINIIIVFVISFKIVFM